MKRKFIKIGMFILAMLSIFSVKTIVHAENLTGNNSRAIYVVFDNSGSMYGPGNMAWSQATYAMEVFASMTNFDSGDTMKIFPMHPVMTGGNSGEDMKSSITIASRADIEQIHNMYTPTPGGTPYTQVNTATQELSALLDSGSVNEGWLVILTDGDFDSDIPADGLRGNLVSKAGIKGNMFIQYLAMGSDVKNVPEGDESVGFYAEKVGNSAETVNALAEISNKIFKRNEYPGYSEGAEMEFDIPLSRLIVFAQGKDVSINSLKNKEGSEISLQDSCAVSYSNTDGAGLTSYVTETPAKDTSLKGEVAIFADTASIVEGNYILDVTGADSVKVYYEPGVTFGASLFKGNNFVEKETIEGGAYKLKVGFVSQLSGNFIESSSLLGEPDYSLVVNGAEQEFGSEGGLCRTIDMEVEGDTLDIEAEVTYLNDYMDKAELSFKVCTLDIAIEGPSDVKLKELEDSSNKLKVMATRNGEFLTEEQWNTAVVKVNGRDFEGNEFAIKWDVEKGEDISTWVLQPRYNGDMFKTGTGEADITVDVAADIEGETYGRAQTVPLTINDDKNVLDYVKRYWPHILGILALLIIIVGYLPPVKKRFPKSMKARPAIRCVSELIGINDSTVKGTFEKVTYTRFVPYVAERGRLIFSPHPVKKTAKLKASKGNAMEIINTTDFAGKSEITFGGMAIAAGYKGNYRLRAGDIIVVKTPEFTYRCTPNVSINGNSKKRK